MTRPQIVRADTLDLQDKSSPTAQDHSNAHPHPAPLGAGPAAPHQEASLRRVEDERNDEEVRLQNGRGNGPRDEPPSDDDDADNENGAVKNGSGDNAAVRLNGGISGEGDDDEEEDMADADAEEDLDDMDRISSSPSISDGGLPFPSTATPGQDNGSPPGPDSSPIHSSPSSQGCGSSSPFIHAPVHFPLSMAAARRPHGVPVRSAKVVDKSPCPPFTTTSLPLHPQNGHLAQSADHHHQCEYTGTESTNGTDAEHADTDEASDLHDGEYLQRVESRLRLMRLTSSGSLPTDEDEDSMQDMLEAVPIPMRCDSTGLTYEVPRRTSSLPRQVNKKATEFARSPTPPLISSHADETDSDSAHEGDSWTDDSDADSWDVHLDDDDDANDVSFTLSDDPRFIDSGWGGECLREVEDIDFEFVYSLHTFVATVEGQANATKGDTMVLLDDSNSYWWLVRVVKDNSIGYLPAEHIETPTERLARLNKHRNIDLSATMLGDTAEKTKNPLKKAMRRRNAKTVQFAQPQYFEPSDYDYSSDEDEGDELFGGADPNQGQQQQGATEKSESDTDDKMKVQPLKVNGTRKERSNSDSEPKDGSEDSAKADSERERGSEDSIDKPLDPKVSRNGTMRNTDSFFKDDNTETRKITLTPNILRDDSSTSTTGSRERGPSLESLEKNGFADKVAKDDKKKKEKKGMLSGLFKRKDKKGKTVGLDSIDSDQEPSSKQSEEYGRESPQSKPSDELSQHERPSTEQTQTQNQTSAPARSASKGKLQKPHRGREESPSKVKGILKTDAPEPLVTQPAAKEPHSDKPATQMTSTMRLVAPEPEETEPAEERARSPEKVDKVSPLSAAASKLNPLSIVKPSQNGEPKEPKPEKVKKAKQRVQLDDFDSEDEAKEDPFADPELRNQPNQHESVPTGRLSESPVHVSAADAQPPNKDASRSREQDLDSQHPPDLTGDTSSPDSGSPISTPTPDDSPAIAQQSKANTSAPRSGPSPSMDTSSGAPPSRAAPTPQTDMETSPPNSSESTTLPAWSDHSLRTYLDDGSDIRDMLLVINDTTGVVPVGPEHPIMQQLFVEETKTVSGLSSQLDSLLNGLLEKCTKRGADKAARASPVARR